MSLQSTYSWHQRQRQLQRSNTSRSFIKSKFLYKKGSSQSLEDEELAMLRKELLTHADKLISATKEKEKQILLQYSNKDREEQNQVSIITSKAVKDLYVALECVREQANHHSKDVSILQKRKGGRMWLNMKRRKKVRFSSTVSFDRFAQPSICEQSRWTGFDARSLSSLMIFFRFSAASRTRCPERTEEGSSNARRNIRCECSVMTRWFPGSMESDWLR